MLTCSSNLYCKHIWLTRTLQNSRVYFEAKITLCVDAIGVSLFLLWFTLYLQQQWRNLPLSSTFVVQVRYDFNFEWGSRWLKFTLLFGSKHVNFILGLSISMLTKHMVLMTSIGIGLWRIITSSKINPQINLSVVNFLYLFCFLFFREYVWGMCVYVFEL